VGNGGNGKAGNSRSALLEEEHFQVGARYGGKLFGSDDACAILANCGSFGNLHLVGSGFPHPFQFQTMFLFSDVLVGPMCVPILSSIGEVVYYYSNNLQIYRSNYP
jgi:hypothetical protein